MQTLLHRYVLQTSQTPAVQLTTAYHEHFYEENKMAHIVSF
jgi:hypothetical protein